MPDFNSYTGKLDMGFWHKLCAEKGQSRHYKRGEYFARCGERMRHIGIVQQGYFKYTVTDAEGDEHISGFSFAGTFVGDYLCATRQQPCMTDIVAVTDAEVLVCHCSVLNDIFKADKEQHLLLADSLFRQVYGWYLDMHRLSPKERYTDLLERCPGLLQNITLKELASYLGITPTHISRIRKGITFGRE